MRAVRYCEVIRLAELLCIIQDHIYGLYPLCLCIAVTVPRNDRQHGICIKSTYFQSQHGILYRLN